MRLIRTLQQRAAAARPLALAIGVFDGVHRGHQAVLNSVVGLARRRGWLSAALSFESMPEASLGLPVPKRLGHPQADAAAIGALGMDLLYSVPFTRSLAVLSPRAFAEGILMRRLRCAAVVVGSGFRFGDKAKGDVAQLRRLGSALGFEVLEVNAVAVAGEAVSSTRLRAAVESGRMAEAARLLGRPWRLQGKVVRGRGLGAKLGFATANLDSPQQALPPRGVWAGRARVLSAKGAGRWWGFAANLGVRPTLGTGLAPSTELHLLGFKGNLRGRTLEAEFFRRLRPEKRFKGLPQLQAQIKKDLVRAAAAVRGSSKKD
jgi:riboflavin kinase/FMN adenylyltransferase